MTESWSKEASRRKKRRTPRDQGGRSTTFDNTSREKIIGSPDYYPGAAPTPDYQRGLYDYYGYPYPTWVYW